MKSISRDIDKTIHVAAEAVGTRHYGDALAASATPPSLALRPTRGWPPKADSGGSRECSAALGDWAEAAWSPRAAVWAGAPGRLRRTLWLGRCSRPPVLEVVRGWGVGAPGPRQWRCRTGRSAPRSTWAELTVQPVVSGSARDLEPFAVEHGGIGVVGRRTTARRRLEAIVQRSGQMPTGWRERRAARGIGEAGDPVGPRRPVALRQGAGAFRAHCCVYKSTKR